MHVRRTLPQRQRSLIGAWCFADHYGPNDVRHSPGMVVPPHPHTGLQTVSWLFDGEIEHRDSAGVHAFVRPGEVNLMTAGAGICHSEVSTAATEVLHGVQLWVALPDSDRNTARDFTHHVPQPLSLDGARLRVLLGELQGVRSPVHTFTPLLGAQVDIDAGADVTLDVDPQFEHGVLVDQGDVEVGGVAINIGDLACQGVGQKTLHIDNTGPSAARVMLLGGTPFAEELVMWWNFVGRSHDDIVLYRELWESRDRRLGDVAGYVGTPSRLPAPPLPTTQLKPRPAPHASPRSCPGRKDQ
jgi:quercetin 2,3-dioxygenase